MDLEFYVRVRTCEKRATGKQPLGPVYTMTLRLVLRCDTNTVIV